jgi:hypothetical protein
MEKDLALALAGNHGVDLPGTTAAAALRDAQARGYGLTSSDANGSTMRSGADLLGAVEASTVGAGVGSSGGFV